MGASEVTVTLVLSLDTDTTSPRAPALPATLMRSARKVWKDAISMILSSTVEEREGRRNVSPLRGGGGNLATAAARI